MEYTKDNQRRKRKIILVIVIFIIVVVGICGIVLNYTKKRNVVQLTENITEQITSKEENYVEVVEEISPPELILEVEQIVQQWKDAERTTDETISLL